LGGEIQLSGLPTAAPIVLSEVNDHGA